MPTVEIRLTVPEGTNVSVIADGATILSDSSTDEVERYYRDYLSENARRVYWAAARIELDKGTGYTLDDIAENISQTYESVRSFHRTSGRTAKKWCDENGTEAPIRLMYGEYEWDESHEGMRSKYKLPPGVAEKVDAVAASLGTPTLITAS